jgi:gliding motility-associated-like protein
MDDGTFETGPDIHHYYDIVHSKLYYTITLTATNNYGCESTFSDIIDIIPFVPNVFSPNGDGINDVFMADLDMEIFDRHGTLLYKGTEGWNGMFKGQVVSPDTYFYAINYSNREGQEYNLKGYVTVVR